jgi:hypothetical protein
MIFEKDDMKLASTKSDCNSPKVSAGLWYMLNHLAHKA